MSGAPVASGSYVPYNKAKRASTASMPGAGRASPVTQPGGLSAPRSPSPTKGAAQPVTIQSPKPQRSVASLNGQSVSAVASSSPSSSVAARSPTIHTPLPAWHTEHFKSASGSQTPLPFQNVSPGSSPFVTPRRGQSPVKQADEAHRLGQYETGSPRTRNVKAPYHSSFQPQGVRRDRTDDFMDRRKNKAEGKKLEEGRLGRRLEKLVALHFPPPRETKELPAERKTSSTLSEIAAFGQSLRGRTAKELWSSVANSKGEVDRAPVNITPLTAETRAPPAPVRPERCSTFFTVEYEGQGTAEKLPVGVIHEVEPAETESALTAFEKASAKPKDERKKVRVCRECLNIVLRQQMKTLPVRTPTWLKLYEVLVQLEKEIEAVLPEFQELVLGLQKPAMNHSQPSAPAAESMRKRLLTSLASYDTLSKRVRELPLNEGSLPGGSQDRLQRAIATRASMFLSEKLALLRSLGDIEEQATGRAKAQAQSSHAVKSLASLLADDKGAPSTAAINEKVGAELEASAKLSVLLEQEALVRSYVEDANARRQFEDAASLKASLNELQEEIRAIRATLA
ncbi:carboxypeptidase Y-deficient [Microbotryomycetes sp. JL201]|nr:carboxypeptidase Y-deficient [Microbotryomycetes sp. JL201]